MRMAVVACLIIGCGDPETKPAANEYLVKQFRQALPPVTSDLGYTVNLDEVKVASTMLEFTSGGEVRGALAGSTYVAAWYRSAPVPLDDAMLEVGTYDGARFTTWTATHEPPRPADDPIIDHTFYIDGMVSKNGVTKPFVARLDAPGMTVTIPFQLLTDEDDGTDESSIDILMFRFVPTPTLFDGIDFFALPGADINIDRDSPIHDDMVRAMTVGELYGFTEEWEMRR